MKAINHLVETLINNGISLQNAVNAYADQAKVALDRMEAVMGFVNKIEQKHNAIINELFALRKESHVENVKIRNQLKRALDRNAKRKKAVKK